MACEAVRSRLLWAPIIFLALATPALCADSTDLEEFRVLYEWSKLDYEWPDDSTKARALSMGQFIPENNALAGIKVWGERVFLSVPRWREGVPATLATVPAFPQVGFASPKLRPFPSWEMQGVGNCSALQNVRSMEVDTMGRLWVLDAGRVYTASIRSDDRCPPKLLVFDLVTGYRMIHKYIFPPNVASSTTSFLSDIVLDGSGSGGAQPDNWYAYISDSGDASIVVYSMKEDRSWKVQDVNSMRADPAARDVFVAGERVNLMDGASGGGVDGLALAPVRHGSRYLYYSPLASYNIYALPTDLLRDSNSASRGVSGAVIDLGRRRSQGRGMVMDERGILYFGLLAQNAVARWNSTNSTSNQFSANGYNQYGVGGGFGTFGGPAYSTEDPRRPFDPNNRGVNFGGVLDGVLRRGSLEGSHVVISADDKLLQWPDTLAFDSTGNLWLTSNRLQNFLNNRVNLDEPNFRVIRGYTGTKSYLYGDGSDGRWSPGSGRGINQSPGGRDDRRWGNDADDTRGTWNGRDDPDDRNRPYFGSSTANPRYSSTYRPINGISDSSRSYASILTIIVTSFTAFYFC
nr:yellow-x3 protein [Ischnura senegalensis]